MRVLMMGTGPFAVPTFRGLVESTHEVLGLITRPARGPTRRRRSAMPVNPMREFAEASGIDVESPESIKTSDAIEQLNDYRADLYVVCDYGQILPAAALATARLGGINLHGSLLPKYRGAAPINWALWDGAEETGVTVIHMTPRLDAGPCLVQHSTPIGATEDAVKLEHRLADIGWRAVSEAIERLVQWDGSSPMGVIQDNACATRAPRLQKSDGDVDWRRRSTDVYNQARAFKPWPGTYTRWLRAKGSLRLLLTDVAVEATEGQSGPPGTVLEADGERLVIACGQGSLRLLELQPAGKHRLGCREFLRGYPLHVGDQLQADAVRSG